MCGRDFTSHVSKVWLETPSQTFVCSFVRSFVRLSVSSVRPSVRRNQTSSSLSLSHLARALSRCSRFASLPRAPRSPSFALLFFASLLLSLLWFCFCLGCSLVDFHFFLCFFWSRTFFSCVFWRNFRNPSNSAAAAAFVFVRGFCCPHVHVSSVWLSIVGDAFISLSQLAVCCTCFCKRKNSDGFRPCFFLFVVEFSLQQLGGNSSASHCGVWYSKIIATTTAALVLDTESEREKKNLFTTASLFSSLRLSYILISCTCCRIGIVFISRQTFFAFPSPLSFCPLSKHVNPLETCRSSFPELRHPRCYIKTKPTIPSFCFVLFCFFSFFLLRANSLPLPWPAYPSPLDFGFRRQLSKTTHQEKKTSTNLSSPLLSSPRGLVWWGSPLIIVIMTLSAPLVVVGSANADMFVEVDRLPKEGETIAAKSGQTFAGGKGANQASCAARLSYPTYFVGQVNLLLLPMWCSCSNAFYFFLPMIF